MGPGSAKNYPICPIGARERCFVRRQELSPANKPNQSFFPVRPQAKKKTKPEELAKPVLTIKSFATTGGVGQKKPEKRLRKGGKSPFGHAPP